MPLRDTRRPLLDKENIRCVRATSFLQFCKQKGVRVMRIHMSELEALATDIDQALTDERSPIDIPDLSEESFRRLVEGNYTMTEARKVFSPPLHDFLAANIAANTGPKLRRKIAEADVEKFLKGKTPLTAKTSGNDSLKSFTTTWNTSCPRMPKPCRPTDPGTTRSNFCQENSRRT